MSFNNGNERRNLNAKWEHLRVQYREAGMSEDAIQAITLEQAIYAEMELAPEMIRSIRTLCGVCLCSFVESKAFKIAIVPSADRSMDTCTVCQTRRGHDYVVVNR